MRPVAESTRTVFSQRDAAKLGEASMKSSRFKMNNDQLSTGRSTIAYSEVDKRTVQYYKNFPIGKLLAKNKSNAFPGANRSREDDIFMPGGERAKSIKGSQKHSKRNSINA